MQTSYIIYYLGLGTNLGDKEGNIRTAIGEIAERVGQVQARSTLYATAPWGFRSDNGFLNAALCVHSALAPLDVLAVTQQIERGMGRLSKSAGGVYADRVIDIDLLLAFRADGAPVVLQTPMLTLPHPLMHLRGFVMQPMAEIAPALLHPLLNKTMAALAAELSEPPAPVRMF